MSDWIKHDGVRRPIPRNTIVVIRMRSGEEIPESWRSKAEEWEWKWKWKWKGSGGDDPMSAGDIVEYRVVSK